MNSSTNNTGIKPTLTQEQVDAAVASLKKTGVYEKLVSDYKKSLENDAEFMEKFDKLCQDELHEKGIVGIRTTDLYENACQLEQQNRSNHYERKKNFTHKVTQELMKQNNEDINSIELAMHRNTLK